MIRVLQDLIINAADTIPDKIAVIHNNKGLTYGEILKKSMQLCRFLLNSGIKKGDRVCFYMEKRFEKVVSIFGISLSGGVIVPIRRLSRIKQVAHIVNDCGARILITTESRVPLVLENINLMPKLDIIISIGGFESIIVPEGTFLIDWNDIIFNDFTSYVESSVTELDLAAILYTSGSTGSPKGVVLNHHNIVAGTKKVSEYLKINKEDRILSILNFGFDYGLNQLTTAFLNLAQIFLLDYLFPKDILNAVEQFKITGLAAVATTWIQLIQISWENTSMHKLRYITNSGGFIPASYVAELRKRLPITDIYLMYGLTEAFRSTYLDPSLVEKYPTSIGKAVPGEEIMLLDENNHPVKPGEIGELVHRGVLVSQGYWNDREMTALRFRKNPLQKKEVIIPETVVFSGDYVKIDDNGLLYFVGRKDEMIKCAGNRISPMEVEEIIFNSNWVSEVIAFGIPHDIYGQTVFAVVSPLPGVDVTPKYLKRYCKAEMAPYMVPSDIMIWNEMPRNTNGKLDRSSIKKEVFRKLGIRKQTYKN